MFDFGVLKRIDFRAVGIQLILMFISLLTIIAATQEVSLSDEITISSFAKNQFRFFAMGIFVYIAVASFDYRKLREWTWFCYIGMIVLLVGLYFVAPIHNVRRWYRIPFLGLDFQPSEIAKLVVVLALSWFLERQENLTISVKTFFKASLIIFVPFVLILKQPDLGTALILCPISIAIFYFAGINKNILRILSVLACVLVAFILLIFTGLLSHEEMRCFFTQFIKEYQYERLNPETYHQKASQTAIALGHYFGLGFCKSQFTGHQFLPYAFTDSVFPAFAEEFGMFGSILLLSLFFGLIYLSFQVTLVARDSFGRFLSAGIAIYLAMHVIVNIGMMTGLLPITGVPLVLVTYGGSSVINTMIALGLLQSIYARRFQF